MGQALVVHTDHLNLLYKKLASACLVRWQMLLEEYGPTVQHIQGEKNIVTDALTRLELSQKQHDEIQDTKVTTQLSYVNQTDLNEVLEEVFPMSPKEIKSHQRKDARLMKSLEEHKEYQLKKVEGQHLVTYKSKIYIPDSLKIVSWIGITPT